MQTPTSPADTILATPNLVSFWDFQEPAGTPRIAKGAHAYALAEAAGSVERIAVEGAPFGPYAADLTYGKFFEIPRPDCPALDIHGPDAQVTVVAWIQRHRKREIHCEAIAGFWGETSKTRQYCLFLDLRINGGQDNVCGHVSATGAPTKGHPWCMDAAMTGGGVDFPYFDWHCVGFTYDAQAIRAYLKGIMVPRLGFNPYAYPHGIFNPGPEGGPFTVGGVHRLGSMGNWFVGRLGGLAIFNRALTDTEMATLATLVPESASTHLPPPEEE